MVEENLTIIVLAGFVMTTLLGVLVERLMPAKHTPLSLGRWCRSIGLWGYGILLSGIIPVISAPATALYADQNSFGLLNYAGAPLWLAIPLGLLILDFYYYAYHFLQHRVTIFWRIHRAHHSDTEIDVSTSFRTHPIDVLLGIVALPIYIAVFGLPVTAVVCYILMIVVWNAVQHTNTRALDRWDDALSWLFVTPRMHRIHHSRLIEDSRHNLGLVFSLWDRLFGTYVPAKGYYVEEFGLDEGEFPKNETFSALLYSPFYTAAPQKADGAAISTDA